jgi:hypothetical protein
MALKIVKWLLSQKRLRIPKSLQNKQTFQNFSSILSEQLHTIIKMNVQTSGPAQHSRRRPHFRIFEIRVILYEREEPHNFYLWIIDSERLFTARLGFTPVSVG